MSKDQATPDQHDENKLIAERRAKLDAIRAERNAFPNDFTRTAEAGHLQAEYGEAEHEKHEDHGDDTVRDEEEQRDLIFKIQQGQ